MIIYADEAPPDSAPLTRSHSLQTRRSATAELGHVGAPAQHDNGHVGRGPHDARHLRYRGRGLGIRKP